MDKATLIIIRPYQYGEVGSHQYEWGVHMDKATLIIIRPYQYDDVGCRSL